MWTFKAQPRKIDTGIACKKCKTKLEARRSCREAYLYCPCCEKKSEIGDYYKEMDDALEGFLEGLNCDRT